MKNILIKIIVIASVFLIQGSLAKASILYESNETALFEVEVGEINKILSTNETHFDFKVKNIVNKSTIDYWKIRGWCEPGLDIRIHSIEGSLCGKAFTIKSFTEDQFRIFMSNSTGKTGGFSFKLKAYDKSGKWLHSEKESFKWK